MSRSLSIDLSFCLVTSIRSLIGPKWKPYIVEEVIEVDGLDEGDLSGAAGQQDK